jgi:protein-tyrosine phosphatase
MPQTVLFLCTGNYYRSRFAEILFNAEAERRGLPWRAESRGLALELGVNNVGPISSHAAGRLAELSIAIDRYLRMPQQVEEADLLRADLVIALKGDEHRPLLLSRHATWVERVEYWDVHDLYDRPPDQALAAIEQAVRELVGRLEASLPPSPF